MSIGKHSLNKRGVNQFKTSNIFKVLLLFLTISVILIVIYYLIKHIQLTSIDTDSNIGNANNLEAIYETSETVSTQESLVVKGAEYLEITGVFINSDNPKLSTVSTKIKNNSDEIHENIELHITLLDKNDETITTLDCNIDTLEPNEETITYCALMQDLSNCVNYFIEIRAK